MTDTPESRGAISTNRRDQLRKQWTRTGVALDGLPPGPRAPAAAQAVLWGLRFPAFTSSAHRRFGPTFTVRIGGLGPSVVTTDRDGIRRLFSGDPLTRRHASDQLKALFGERTVVVLEPAEHLERRRLLLPTFHAESIRAFRGAIEDITRAAIDAWRVGEVVEILPFAQRLSLEVILQLLFGPSSPEARTEVREIFDSMVSLPGSAVGGYFPFLVRRSRWNVVGERYWRLRDRLDETLMTLLVEARTNPAPAEAGAPLPLMPTLSAQHGGPLSDLDLRDEMKALVTAGHETTATGLAWAFEYLAHTPRIQIAVHDAALSAETNYLDAFVKEVLRIRPPVPIATARRLTVPFQLGEFVIPAGVPILVNAFGLHHDPALFPQPEEIRVERFLDSAPDPYTYLPFGGGARHCIGWALAQLEMQIVLALVLGRFGLEPTGNQVAGIVRRGITLAPRNRARVRLTEPLPRSQAPAQRDSNVRPGGPPS